MQRYLIFGIALIAGLLVLIVLKRVAERHMRGEALLPYRYIVAGAAAILVMLAGGILLETNSGNPDMGYQPPYIENGEIKAGQFNDK